MSSDLDALAATFCRAATDAPRVAAPVIKRAAVNIKKQWRNNAKESAGKHAKAYPWTVTFDDVQVGLTGASTEIGPESRGQGNLGHLLEYGSATSAPHNDGGRALDGELPNLAGFLTAALVKDLAR